VPLYLRHGPEKDVHRFPGCLIVFVTDKAVLLGCFLEDRRMVHPQGYLRPDLCKHLVRTLGDSSDFQLEPVRIPSIAQATEVRNHRQGFVGRYP